MKVNPQQQQAPQDPQSQDPPGYVSSTFQKLTNNTSQTSPVDKKITTLDWIVFSIYVVCFFIAIYLSWTANLTTTNAAYKVISAIVAGFQGPMYFVYYFFMKYDLVKAAKQCGAIA